MITTMKKLVAAASALSALALLTACAPVAEEAAPEPTETQENVNIQACDDFATATFHIEVGDDAKPEDWYAVRDEVDMAALSAEGDVKERLTVLVDEWPDKGDVLYLGADDAMNDLLHSVGRACEAAGHAVEYNYFVKQSDS